MSEQYKQFFLAWGMKRQGTQSCYGVLHLLAKLPPCQITSFYSDLSVSSLLAWASCWSFNARLTAKNSVLKIHWELKQSLIGKIYFDQSSPSGPVTFSVVINKLFNWICWESKQRPTDKLLIKIYLWV